MFQIRMELGWKKKRWEKKKKDGRRWGWSMFQIRMEFRWKKKRWKISVQNLLCLLPDTLSSKSNSISFKRGPRLWPQKFSCQCFYYKLWNISLQICIGSMWIHAKRLAIFSPVHVILAFVIRAGSFSFKISFPPAHFKARQGVQLWN